MLFDFTNQTHFQFIRIFVYADTQFQNRIDKVFTGNSIFLQTIKLRIE